MPTEAPEPLLTIVTPTFNRANLLGRLKESLHRQGESRFNWLVVDDGSSDGTPDLLAAWGAEQLPFQLQSVRQGNGGKHRALNTALQHITTQWFMVVDSDDWLMDGGVSRVEGWLTPPITDETVVGVGGLRLYPDGSPIGGLPKVPANSDHIECGNLERGRFGLLGDKAEIYRTEVARRYPYPEFPGEKFIEEGVVGDAMAADGYRLRWYPEGVYYCEYQPDGLSARIDRHHAASFEGYTAFARQYIHLRCGREPLLLIGVYTDVASQKGIARSEVAERLGVPWAVVAVMGSIRRAVRIARSWRRARARWRA